MVLLLVGRPCYYVDSVGVMKQLFDQEGKIQLVKPLELTTAKMRGDIATYKAMSSVEGWETEDEILIPEINLIILRFTFIMMAKCGFGLPVWWATRIDDSDAAALEGALSIASKTLIPRFILPRWAYYLPFKKLHEIDRAWNSVILLMGKLVLARKEEFLLDDDADNNNNIFNRLTANILSILFAGNEPSASVLVTTIVCLALNQGEQAKAFDEIQRVITPDRDPCEDDIKGLVHISACMQEAQHLIHALLLMPRDIMENGARVVVDDIAMYHNPNYFPESDKYLPSRWYGHPEQGQPGIRFRPQSMHQAQVRTDRIDAVPLSSAP
ncbi:cytochrome P450 [Mycena rosella]|uniref:Cytochrome P450 n=1 Tax=Mycena rosella TaxID=1033263 RepID=A0AAD7D0I0_MYCRO|nr:cytochrome P450 [Mycena rosella]